MGQLLNADAHMTVYPVLTTCWIHHLALSTDNAAVIEAYGEVCIPAGDTVKTESDSDIVLDYISEIELGGDEPEGSVRDLLNMTPSTRSLRIQEQQWKGVVLR